MSWLPRTPSFSLGQERDYLLMTKLWTRISLSKEAWQEGSKRPLKKRPTMLRNFITLFKILPWWDNSRTQTKMLPKSGPLMPLSQLWKRSWVSLLEWLKSIGLRNKLERFRLTSVLGTWIKFMIGLWPWLVRRYTKWALPPSSFYSRTKTSWSTTHKSILRTLEILFVLT